MRGTAAENEGFERKAHFDAAAAEGDNKDQLCSGTHDMF